MPFSLDLQRWLRLPLREVPELRLVVRLHQSLERLRHALRPPRVEIDHRHPRVPRRPVARAAAARAPSQLPLTIRGGPAARAKNAGRTQQA